jgi:hypothetical protein
VSELGSDAIPLSMGNKWVYRVDAKLISMDFEIEVTDSKNSRYLINFSGGGMNGSVVIKSDVDLSVVAYSKVKAKNLDNTASFEVLPKSEIIKSPVVTGAAWTNNLGRFTIVDSNYRLKSGTRIFDNCIHLHLDDTSNTGNDFYIKEGIGILHAQMHVDGIGLVTANLKKFN